MTLFDDNTDSNLESATLTTVAEHTAGSSEASTSDSANPQPSASAQPQHTTEEQPQPPQERPASTSASSTDDFASALESFTTETEEAAGDDNVIRGTVLKLTPTHVVVDIGAKSEGMLPIAEVMDHEGKPRFQPGDEASPRLG